LVDLDATPFYHCINRCVRSCYLLGDDRLTGRNFDHRKQWVADRIQELCTIFAAGACSYGLMSNHMHLVLRIDRDRATAWSEEEVADRYEKLFPATVMLARELPDHKLSERVAVWRWRLFDLSWFMRCLDESIARRANREDHVPGRFWEGRFRSVALLDVGALMTCMAYVDLNPIRAHIAETLEDSDFTSIQARLVAAAEPDRKIWLLPFADQVQPRGRQDDALDSSRQEPLPLTYSDYEELLRWTVEGLRAQQPEQLLPAPRVLKEAGLSDQGFVETIRTYEKRFFTMVGSVHRIDLEAKRRQYKRRPGIGSARRLYQASG